MLATIKSLAKDTAVYGLSSIIGRFLNWCLVPVYTIVFPAEEYGVVTYIYSFVAIALVILIYGMETGFFRFVNDADEKNPIRVYSTALLSIAATSIMFLIAVCCFITPISDIMELPAHPDYILIMAATVAIDAFTAIPFCYLRYKKCSMRFATIKLIGIAINIALNIFFIIGCPYLMKVSSQSVSWFYDSQYGVGYIFLANLLSSLAVLIMLCPELRIKYVYSVKLFRKMFRYSFPILVLGVAGIMNQSIDKILIPYILRDSAEAWSQVGIYGANYKIAIVMVMFIQAFRFAYEPVIFSQNREKNVKKTQLYADAMKYFIIFGYVIFLGVMFYLPVLKFFIGKAYFVGLSVVPVVMMAELFNGIFFNLSLWYKLTDRTVWGSYFSILGLVVTLTLNFLLVPKMGYMGAAWAAFFCYLVMMLASYFVGKKYYPIQYDIKSATCYGGLMLILYILGMNLPINSDIWLLTARTPIFIAFLVVILIREPLPKPKFLKKIV
ncbi:MAG: oligosaccharide flippase family protein [Muribaculaceae bacterium]|nr:oligosaccharide flippase family protein [Muribaculaceae bacterium]